MSGFIWGIPETLDLCEIIYIRKNYVIHSRYKEYKYIFPSVTIKLTVI